jgi:hypothetical protein
LLTDSGSGARYEAACFYLSKQRQLRRFEQSANVYNGLVGAGAR